MLVVSPGQNLQRQTHKMELMAARHHNCIKWEVLRKIGRGGEQQPPERRRAEEPYQSCCERKPPRSRSAAQQRAAGASVSGRAPGSPLGRGRGSADTGLPCPRRRKPRSWKTQSTGRWDTWAPPKSLEKASWKERLQCDKHTRPLRPRATVQVGVCVWRTLKPGGKPPALLLLLLLVRNE